MFRFFPIVSWRVTRYYSEESGSIVCTLSHQVFMNVEKIPLPFPKFSLFLASALLAEFLLI